MSETGVNPADVQLIEQIQQATQGASRLLSTLARRGKAMERDEPPRATFLLAAVRTHPLYKGGRLAFDMLEIEDLMLDGPPLDSISAREVIHVLNAGAHRLADTLMRMGSAQKGRTPAEPFPDTAPLTGSVRGRAGSVDEAAASVMPRVSLGPSDSVALVVDESPDSRSRAPELLASDYLYDYVVLGFLDVLGGMSASSS